MDNAPTLDARQQRGLAIARDLKARIRQIVGGKYVVPSATGAGEYVVDADERRCSCPDHEERLVRCKHLWAISYLRAEVEMPDGSTVVTEAVQAVRLSHPQPSWAAYNRAQCEEGDVVPVLLSALCDGIVEPPRGKGRPRIALRDCVFSAAMKVYGTMSGRRSDADIRACAEDGHIGKAPSYNTGFRTMEREDLTPLFTTLVAESARPLAEVESQFAQDSTGFSTFTYVRWFDHRYGTPVPKQRQRFVKLHAMTGTLTNAITAARVSSDGDATVLPALVEATAAAGFKMAEISADKAYLSHDNLAAIEKVGAVPYIPFKENSRAEGSAAWKRMWGHFMSSREDFLAHYHRRSNVEATFSALKRKFGSSVRSKLPAAQTNEVLLKCLCHNLTCLVHAIHELNVDPKFWMPRPALATGTP